MHDTLKTSSETHVDVQHPKGALAITFIYLAMIIAGWCFIYFTTVGRGVNQ